MGTVHDSSVRAISLSQIAAALGGSAPYSLSKYRRGGSYTPSTVSRPYQSSCPYATTCTRIVYGTASTGQVYLGTQTHGKDQNTSNTYHIYNYTHGATPSTVHLSGRTNQTVLTITTDGGTSYTVDTGNNSSTDWSTDVDLSSNDSVYVYTNDNNYGGGSTTIYMDSVQYTTTTSEDYACTKYQDCTLYQDVTVNSSVANSLLNLSLSQFYGATNV
jgi:hypothetical protein